MVYVTLLIVSSGSPRWYMDFNWFGSVSSVSIPSISSCDKLRRCFTDPRTDSQSLSLVRSQWRASVAEARVNSILMPFNKNKGRYKECCSNPLKFKANVYVRHPSVPAFQFRSTREDSISFSCVLPIMEVCPEYQLVSKSSTDPLRY